MKTRILPEAEHDPHPTRRCGSPGHPFQFRGKQFAARKTIFVQDADEVLAGFLLFGHVIAVDP